MATYKLNYTGAEINSKLETVDRAITDIEAVIDEGNPQLTLKQGEAIIGVVDLTPIKSAFGGASLKNLEDLFDIEQTEQFEFTVMNKTYDEARTIILENYLCGFLFEMDINPLVTNGKVGALVDIEENQLTLSYGSSRSLVYIRNVNGVAKIYAENA